jgi:hypothetical protein
MRLDASMCLAASAVIATTASLWGIEAARDQNRQRVCCHDL